MSIETIIQENTEALKALTAAIIGNKPVAVATEAETESEEVKEKRKRRTKAEMEAARAAEQAATAPVVEATAIDGYLIPGDPAGTRYFDIPAHNSVYRQAPGEPDCKLPSAMIVPGHVYTAKKQEYASRFQLATPSVASEPAGAPVTSQPVVETAPAPAAPAADAPTLQSITAKLMQLHKRDGNPGVKAILDKFGVAKATQLGDKNLVEVDAAVEAALAPSLFD